MLAMVTRNGILLTNEVSNRAQRAILVWFCWALSS